MRLHFHAADWSIGNSRARTCSRESSIELFSRSDRDNINEFGATIETADCILRYRLSSFLFLVNEPVPPPP